MNRIILSILLVVGVCDLLAKDIYVGGAGASDNNPGTATQPFATIQKAASVAVAGDVVKIRTGTYRETIVPANSGTAGNPITFEADNGAIVTVSGLNPADGGWTLHSGGIYKKSINLPVNGYQNTLSNNTTILANQIFKDGQMQFEARWPKINKPEDLFDRSKWRPIAATNSPPNSFSNTQIQDNALAGLGNLTGGKIFINGWFVSGTRTITNHSGSSISYSSYFDMTETGRKFRKFYYVTGKLSLLTQAKEWHYESGTLYFWQEGGGVPTGVEYKARNWGFDLMNKSNITIQGLQFFGCEPMTGNTSSNNIVLKSIKGRYTNHMVAAEVSSPQFDPFWFTNALQSGIKLIGNNCVVQDSEFDYGAGQCIWLGQGGIASNNRISNYSYEGNYGAAVSCWGNTGGQIIRWNSMFRLGRSGIDWTNVDHGQHLNMTVEYNDIYDFMMLNLDAGGIYGGRHMNLTGTRVHHNWIHDSKAYDTNAGGGDNNLGIHTGFYLDQATGPVTFDHNVLWNNVQADVYNQMVYTDRNAGPSRLYNNTFITLAMPDGHGQHFSYVTYITTPNDIQRNNIYLDDLNINHGASLGDILYSIRKGTNPQFINTGASGLAYRLRAGSPAINAGVIIPGITDGSIGVPDCGAYEFGGPDWVPGYKPVTTPPPTNTPPVGSITAPANNASFTQGSSITITASASDSDGSVTKVEFYNGTTKLGEDAVSPYSFVWANASTGTHTLTVRVTDNASSVATSAAVTITVSGNVSPTISLTSPINNAQFQTGTAINLSATASDSDGSVTRVEFFNGTTKLGEDVTSPYGFTWINAPAGTHTLTARATDNQNSITTSTAVQIVVSANTPPVVSITSPTNNARFAPSTPITISATATDANGTIAKVEFYNGTTKLGEDLTSPYSFVWTPTVVGTYTLTARATDNQTSVATSSPVQVRIFTNAPPTASIKNPKTNSQFRTGEPINIEAEASDTNGSITKVEFYSGSTKLGEDLSSPYNFIWNEPSTGTHSLTVRAIDNENSATISSPVQVLIVGPDSPPSISITSPSANSQFTPGDTVVITAEATDANGAITKVEFFDGTTKLGEDTTAPYSLNWSTLAVGTYDLHAVATDEQNTTTTSSIVSISIMDPNNLQEQNQDLYSAIPRIFTPNGDGDKDVWEWEGIERFENSFLTVYNRNGQPIYEAYSYNNTWDGTMNGQPLQPGDYYYVLVLEDSTRLQAAFRIYR